MLVDKLVNGAGAGLVYSMFPKRGSQKQAFLGPAKTEPTVEFQVVGFRLHFFVFFGTSLGPEYRNLR